MTALHRIFCPLRFADISHSSSVYWIIVTINASRLYPGLFCVQNFVYRLCGDGFGPGTGKAAPARARRESWYRDRSWIPLWIDSDASSTSLNRAIYQSYTPKCQLKGLSRPLETRGDNLFRAEMVLTRNDVCQRAQRRLDLGNRSSILCDEVAVHVEIWAESV